jgi:glucose-6-phosphate 1-dehydrogenase
MKNNKPTILIIIGISGDLSCRKLLPAISQIAISGMLPKQFKIVGVTRQNNMKIDNLLNCSSDKDYLREHIELFKMDLNNIGDYKKLGDYLNEIPARLEGHSGGEKDFGGDAQRLFYLSVPPTVAKDIIAFIGDSGLARTAETKLLLEKPFGVDLESATELAKHINKYFAEEQVYRIDHYMAKETAQNIIVFREGNSLFKKTWNKNFIESITITASENIGIEGRAIFYEQTGALRDLVQSHLLQLLALALMELPEKDKFEDVPALRLEALKHLSIPSDKSMNNYAKRGQYEGYRDEVGNKDSNVETFVSLTLKSNDPRWAGVPITLLTGKALKDKFTEIKILYKKDNDMESNELLLRIQPDEGISFSIFAKRPGYEHQISRHALGFSFKEHYSQLPEAYEQVLFNAINSDHSLFTSSGEVLETWRILNALQKTWAKSADDLIIYKEGSDINEIVN